MAVVPAFVNLGAVSSGRAQPRIYTLPVDSDAQLDFPLPKELWIKFAIEAVLDPSLSPQESSRVRGILASLSKGWHASVSNLSELWSYIPIYKDTTLDRIRFYLARCPTGDLDISLLLRDVCFILNVEGTKDNLFKAVDNIFAVIAPTAHRWRSFRFTTENPFAFARVQFHCQDIRADTLYTLDVSYVYMAGYSSYVSEPGTFERPFQCHTWFSGQLPNVHRLAVFCTAVQWDAVGMYDNLEVLELADYSRCPNMKPEVLPILFRRARRLRVLRIAHIRPLQFPVGTSLRSTTLRVVDIHFAYVDFTSAFLGVLDAPGIIDLTVRQVYDCVDVLLVHPFLLMRLTRFTVRGDIGDVISLHLLFSALASLEVLDLTHSLAHVFESYCDWAISRPRLLEPNLAVNLLALHLGRFNIDSLLDLVTFVIRSMPDDAVRSGITTITVDSPSPPAFRPELLETLRELVPEFVLTDMWSSRGLPGPMSTCNARQLFIDVWLLDNGYLTLLRHILTDVTTIASSVPLDSQLDSLVYSSETASSRNVTDSQPVGTPPALSGHPVYAPWQTIVPFIPALANTTPVSIPSVVTTVPSLSVTTSIVPIIIPMPNIPLEIEMAIFDLIPIALEDDNDLDFLGTRGAILLSCRLHNDWVRNDARWWTRLLISPQVPIHYVEQCLYLSDLLELSVRFSATFDPSRPLSIGSDGNQCAFDVYAEDAVEVLSQDLDRCVQLDIVADTPHILGQVLDPLRWTSPDVLRRLLVSFSIGSFEDFMPTAISTFSFGTLPPFGPPFPPFTTLTWSSADVSTPTITYTMHGQSACSIAQPHERPVSWDDLFPVISHSSDLHTLDVDGISMDYLPLRLPVASFPILSLRILKLTLRGDESLAFLISRLNLPALHYFRVVLADDRDVRCLTSCASILSNIEELVIVGRCTHTPDLEILLSLARRIVTLDLRLVSDSVFHALHAASASPPPSGTVNFSACPALRSLSVSGVPLHSIKSLLTSRRINNMSRLDNIRAANIGRDVLDGDIAWFSSRGIQLTVDP
ncbi:hypothetical protein C8R43DRAFT_960032 [Mycena crocata]|nr:hypothetical protein C8R43DRAFT_960032 [Mycena crocata]